MMVHRYQILPNGTFTVTETVSHLRSNSHLYHNEQLNTFFRRPTFTPDGLVLISPSGLVRDESNTSANAVHFYTRGLIKK